MIVTSGTTQRNKIIEALPDKVEAITIKKGDRIIHLSPVDKLKGDYFAHLYNVTFYNNAKGVKIRCVDFGYYTHYRKHGELIFYFGAKAWEDKETGEPIDKTLKEFDIEHGRACMKWIDKTILEYFGLNANEYKSTY